jgi:glycosyltransferase involved in cell wall biosynthesis
MPEAEVGSAFLPAHVESARVRPLGILRIALYSSKRDRCGIATYTSHLEDALASFGHDVQHWGSQAPHDAALDTISRWKPDVFHVQHEPSIMPPEGVLIQKCLELREAGTKVVVTLHTETEQTLQLARKLIGLDGVVILHRPTSAMKDAVVIAMPCTVLGIRQDHYELRRKFNLPADAFVISTVGFMIPWKDHPRIVEAMIPWLTKRPDIHIQIIASEHFSPDLKVYAQVCRTHLASIASGLGGRIHHVDDYPSDLEIVERLAASDLGYVWCPVDTGSSSAAAAQFTTARCPLVATDSTHYAWLGTGIVRSLKDVKAFTELIEKTAEDPQLLCQLKSNQWDMYRNRNYIETARKHLALYEKKVDA